MWVKAQKSGTLWLSQLNELQQLPPLAALNSSTKFCYLLVIAWGPSALIMTFSLSKFIPRRLQTSSSSDIYVPYTVAWIQRDHFLWLRSLNTGMPCLAVDFGAIGVIISEQRVYLCSRCHWWATPRRPPAPPSAPCMPGGEVRDAWQTLAPVCGRDCGGGPSWSRRPPATTPAKFLRSRGGGGRTRTNAARMNREEQGREEVSAEFDVIFCTGARVIARDRRGEHPDRLGYARSDGLRSRASADHGRGCARSFLCFPSIAGGNRNNQEKS